MNATHGGFDTVAETGQVYEAELMALRLREAGIEVQVLDQSYRQEPLPSVRSFALVRVLVPAAQAGEARRILAEGGALPDDAESDDSVKLPEETK
jgi:acetyl esterase/lipase